MLMSTNRRISFSNDFPKLFLPAFFGYRRRVLTRFPFLDFFQGKYRQPHVGICINRFPFLHLVKSLSSNIAYFGQEGYHEQQRWTKDFLQDEERETD